MPPKKASSGEPVGTSLPMTNSAEDAPGEPSAAETYGSDQDDSVDHDSQPDGALGVSDSACKFKGCTQPALVLMGSTPYCMAHGDSKQCQYDGCFKASRCGTPYCIAHGGGKRCQHEGCTKGAVGKVPYCKSHGGGKRCQFELCNKSAEGKTSYCIGHGGGRRCQQEGCAKSSRSGTTFCIAHGGGKNAAKTRFARTQQRLGQCTAKPTVEE